MPHTDMHGTQLITACAERAPHSALPPPPPAPLPPPPPSPQPPPCRPQAVPAGTGRHRGGHRPQHARWLRRQGGSAGGLRHRPALRHRAQQVRGAGRARRRGARQRRAQHPRRLPLQDRKRHPIPGLRPQVGRLLAGGAGRCCTPLPPAAQPCVDRRGQGCCWETGPAEMQGLRRALPWGLRQSWCLPKPPEHLQLLAALPLPGLCPHRAHPPGTCAGAVWASCSCRRTSRAAASCRARSTPRSARR
jgi:hypothetical protein